MWLDPSPVTPPGLSADRCDCPLFSHNESFSQKSEIDLPYVQGMKHLLRPVSTVRGCSLPMPRAICLRFRCGGLLVCSAELCLVRCEADSAGIHLTHSSERGTFEHCSKTDKHTAHLTLCDANAS
ncbi:hypothetical protein J6590_047002 [Homalodisca vitripennis]|nr:hypothetical protein J6590_047002 [Homalodisca vitripennis]